MKTCFFMSLLWLALVCLPVAAQTADPAKIAEYQKRFEQGYALQQQGKFADARAVYDGILAQEPNARRSLLEAGRSSLKLAINPQLDEAASAREYAKADAYLSKLHTLEPDFPEAIELLIQANQALKRDVKVLLLIKQFRELHDSNKIPQFSQSLYFVREVIPLRDSTDIIVFSQYFNYTDAPLIVWKAQVLDSQSRVKRQLSLIYDPKATQELRKDPKLAGGEQFILIEDVLDAGKVTRVDAYFQMFALPEYKKIRNTMIAVIGGAYKPVYSQAVTPSAQ